MEHLWSIDNGGCGEVWDRTRRWPVKLSDWVLYAFTSMKMTDHRSYAHSTTKAVVKFKPGNNSGLNVIRAHDHDLCGTGAVLHKSPVIVS